MVSVNKDIEQLENRMGEIENSLTAIKEDLRTVIQTLSRASSRCSILNNLSNT
jgi:archaellum component FlaC